jgi:Ice-binding-like/Secretion system C-terminal sorting domain
MKNQFYILSIIPFFFFPVVSFAQVPDLGAAANFVLFTTTGAVSNTGVSVIIHKIGSNNGAITGFTHIPGQEENANTVTEQAATDLQEAYDAMYIAPETKPNHAAILGNGETLTPGVYLIPEAASIEGELILDAQGNSNAIFIIKVQGAFSPGPSSQISLMGGAQVCNIYWLAEGGAIAVATLGSMKGNFMANPGAVSMAASSQLEGRLLSTTGAIAVDGVIATLPVCLNTLPVTLLSFTATKQNITIDLLWTVDNESSFAAYNVERSADGQHFSTIGTKIPTTMPGSKNYNWIDNSPHAMLNFYRLKMIDTDGGFKYSRVFRINMNPTKGILIYPNPTLNQMIWLQMNGQLKGEYTLNLYTAMGIKVMSSKIWHTENDETRTIILDKKLPTGNYFLEITSPGMKKKTLKIFINGF